MEDIDKDDKKTISNNSNTFRRIVKKAPRAKVVLPTVEDVEAHETLATLPPASHLDHATTVTKAKAIPTAHTTKAKAKTTLPPATPAIANPN